MGDETAELSGGDHLEVARPWNVDIHHLLEDSGAAGHDHDPVRKENSLGDRMRDEDDCRPRGHADLLELQIHLFARHGVQRAERLVHQQERRRQHERARDRHALLHAARELVGVLPLEAFKTDQGNESARRLGALLAADASDLRRQFDIGLHIAPREQDGILKHNAEIGCTAAALCLAEA